MQEQSPPWGRVTKITITFVILAALGALLYAFREALPPLVIASLVAYILNPVVNVINTRTRLPRGLAALLIYLVVVAVVGLAIGLLAPALVRQVSAFQLDLQEVTIAIEKFLTREYTIGEITFDFTNLYTELQRELTGLIRPAVTQTLQLAAQAVTTLIWLIFIWIISFYLLKDGPQFGAQIEMLVPPHLRSDYRRLKAEIVGIWRDFFRGQLLVGLAMGTSILVLMGAVGLPNILVMALLAAVLEFLPSLGHTIWLLIAIPMALFQGSLWLPLPNFWFAVLVLFLHFILQQVDLNLYIPRLVGRRVHLHPLIVIMGIIIGGILAGVLGVFLAAPIISSLRALARYVYCKLLDIPPWVEEKRPEEGPITPGWLQAVWPHVEERVRRKKAKAASVDEANGDTQSDVG